MRLVGTFGDPRGRLSSAVMLAVPSAVAPAEAFVVTGGLARHRHWHRVDVTTGAELETHDLRMETATPVDLTGDGTRAAFTGDHLRVREHTGDLVWRRKGGWHGARFVDRDTRLLAWTANGTVAELDAATGDEVYRVRGYPPVAVDDRFLGLYLGRGRLGLVDRTTGTLVAGWPGVASAVLPHEGGLLTATSVLAYRMPGFRSPVWTVPTVPSGQLIPSAGRVLAVGRDMVAEHAFNDPAVPTVVPAPTGKRRFTADGSRAAVWRGNAFWGWTRDGEVGRTGQHESPVTSVAVDPEGTRIASFANDRTIRIWDTATGEPVRTIEVDHGPCHLTLDRTAVTAGWWTTVRRWDLRTGEPVDPGFPPTVDHWQYSPDGTLLWVVEPFRSWSLLGSLIRLADGTTLWQGEVSAGTAGFGADGVVVLVRGGVLTVNVATVPLSHLGRSDLPTFDPTATRLARYTGQNTVVVNDARTGVELGRAEVGGDGPPVFAGPDRLLVLDRAGRLHVLAVPGLATLATHLIADARSLHAGRGDDFYLSTARGVVLRYSLDRRRNVTSEGK